MMNIFKKLNLYMINHQLISYINQIYKANNFYHNFISYITILSQYKEKIINIHDKKIILNYILLNISLINKNDVDMIHLLKSLPIYPIYNQVITNNNNIIYTSCINKFINYNIKTHHYYKK